MKQRKAISLFSGAMGLDLGLEKAGIRTAIVVEKNTAAVSTIRANRPALPVIDREIESVSTTEILQRGGLVPGDAFVLTGGPCCQSFSTAGKRGSLGDDRGRLFRHFKRVVKETRPRFFVMENVKGMLSAAVSHRPLDQRGPGHPPLREEEELGSAFRLICEELREIGYYVRFRLINCADYGVPQVRHRVIFIGSRDGEPIRIPAPTHSQSGGDGLLPWVTLRDAIHNISEANPEYHSLNSSARNLLARIPPGQNWRALPPSLRRVALGAAADSWGGRCGFCRRLSWDKPAPTLTTAPNGRATMMCHPIETRPLSIKEYSRLQQFPIEWEFSGSTTAKYAQIGNAVPVGIGEAIGRMLVKVANHTSRVGLPAMASQCLGQLVCEDPELEKRLSTRARTQLHPSRLRLISDPVAAREWLSQTG